MQRFRLFMGQYRYRVNVPNTVLGNPDPVAEFREKSEFV